MLSKFVIFSLPVLSWTASSYTYDRCDSTNGPSAWGGSCNPSQQNGSPIDLCGGVGFTISANFGNDYLLTSGYSGLTTQLTNTGRTLQLQLPLNSYIDPVMYASTVPTSMGFGTTGNSNYNPIYVQLRWGRSVNEGSEHYIQGQRYPLEVQIIHYNNGLTGVVTDADVLDGPANYARAVASGKPEALMVLSIPFQVGDTDFAAITAIADKAATATQTATELTGINLGELFLTTGSSTPTEFYAYSGSLTTPDCNPVALWFVMKTPRSVTQATLNKIYAATTNPPSGTEAISKFGNFRPLQARAGRTVYYTTTGTATTTAACGTVSEPTFTCAATTAATTAAINGTNSSNSSNRTNTSNTTTAKTSEGTSLLPSVLLISTAFLLFLQQ